MNLLSTIRNSVAGILIAGATSCSSPATTTPTYTDARDSLQTELKMAQIENTRHYNLKTPTERLQGTYNIARLQEEIALYDFNATKADSTINKKNLETLNQALKARVMLHPKRKLMVEDLKRRIATAQQKVDISTGKVYRECQIAKAKAQANLIRSMESNGPKLLHTISKAK